jgi:tetratricopeptide (TPR) repeat protein
MANRHSVEQCPEDRLNALLGDIRQDERRGMRELDTVLGVYPNDPRLHFLHGSLLAGRQDYAAARAAMQRAVELAPNYAVARFLLGFLLLTSGEPIAAQETWGPLHALPEEHYLRPFVTGLTHLIHDEFSDAIRLLEQGISRNQENAPMNRDMQLIIEEARRKSAGKGGAVSSVDLLLQQAALKSSRH